MYGDNWKEQAPLEHQTEYWSDLCDLENNWNSDQDFGPTMWRTDVGETDHIEIYRITEEITRPQKGLIEEL